MRTGPTLAQPCRASRSLIARARAPAFARVPALRVIGGRSPPARTARLRRASAARRPILESASLRRPRVRGGRGRPDSAAPFTGRVHGAPGAWLALRPPGPAARAAGVACKPGSVPTPRRRGAGEDHSSRRRIAAPLERSTRALALARFGRVTLDSAPTRACSGRGLPRRRSPGCRAWALTPRFHPCLFLPSGRSHATGGSTAIGGVVSVALSLGLPRVAVNDLPALWSPDFPPASGCSPAILRPPPAPRKATRAVRSRKPAAALRKSTPIPRGPFRI